MPKSLSDDLETKTLAKRTYVFFDIVQRERLFLAIILILGVLCLRRHRNPGAHIRQY